MAVREIDEGNELELKLLSLLPLLSPQRDDAASPPPEILLNSASPSTISSGTQQARTEFLFPAELPTPPGPPDDPSDGENDGGLGALLHSPGNNSSFGHYDGDANSSTWRPEDFFERVGFDTDDTTQVLGVEHN